MKQDAICFQLFKQQLITELRATIRVHSVLEKSLKMLEFRKKNSRPLKVLENRKGA